MPEYGQIADGTLFLLADGDAIRPVCVLCEGPLDPNGDFERIGFRRGKPSRNPGADLESAFSAHKVYACCLPCRVKAEIAVDREKASPNPWSSRQYDYRKVRLES